MSAIRCIFTLLGAWLFLLPVSTGQELWPGDINNNGIVNSVDLLYYGIAFGTAGPPRSNGSATWQAQAATALWGQEFPGGPNYAYADCDGNGQVDEDDFDDAIEDNFWLTHGTLQPDNYSTALPGNGLAVQLIPSSTLVSEGQTVEITLSLGSVENPVPSFYGIAMAMEYRANLLEPGSFTFDDDDDRWTAADGAPEEQLFVPDGPSGRAELGITRLNQQSIGPGFGELGTFSIVIEDIIVGLTVDTFRLRIDSILLIDHEFKAYPTVPASVEILVAKDPALVGTTQNKPATGVRLFPNPASGKAYLEYPGRASQLRLINALGREVPFKYQPVQGNASLYEFFTGSLPPGAYFLTGRGNKGYILEKLIIKP